MRFGSNPTRLFTESGNSIELKLFGIALIVVAVNESFFPTWAIVVLY
jgi:hypothetical protein